MKKILVLAMFCISLNVISQNIPNSGFENWINIGPSLMPEGWTSSSKIMQSPLSNTGMYSIQLVVDTMSNPMMGIVDTVASSAYTGQPIMGPPPAPGTSFGGYAFTGKPDSLTGWVKYISEQGDGFRITVQLSNWNTVSSSRNIIAEAFYTESASINEFTRFAIPLMYFTTDMPDTAFVSIESADMMFKHIGTSLWVDDVDFTFNNLSVDNIYQNNKINIFPNPAKDHIRISSENDMNGYQIKIINSLSQVIYHATITQSELYIDLNEFSDKGICIVQLYDPKGNLKEVKRIIIL